MGRELMISQLPLSILDRALLVAEGPDTVRRRIGEPIRDTGAAP